VTSLYMIIDIDGLPSYTDGHRSRRHHQGTSDGSHASREAVIPASSLVNFTSFGVGYVGAAMVGRDRNEK
jgi:hypothetical protein